jgi:tetratricopeptide (TPR) repeat protein
MKKITNILILSISIVIIAACSSADKSDKNMEHLIRQTLSDLSNVDTAWFNLKAREHVIRGSKLQQQQRYAEALIQFQQALRYDSSYVIQYAMAKSYKEMEEFELALEYLMKSLDREPEFIPALELTGEIFLTQYKIDRAIKVYEKIYDIEPTEGHLFDLARLYELDDTEKSIELYEELIGRAEKPIYYKRLANLYKTTDRQKKYIETLEKLYELAPGNTSVAVELMLEYSKNQNYGRSREFLDEAQNYLPSSELVICYGAFAEALVNDTTAAVKSYIPEFLADVDNKFFSHWRIHLMSGILANKIDSVQAAEEFFGHALSVADSIPEPPLQIGLNYYDNNKYERGIGVFGKYEEIFPKDWRFPFFLAHGYVMIDSTDSALPPIRRAAAIDSSTVEIWSLMGTIYDELDMHDSSAIAYEKALTIDEDNALVKNNYAYSLADRGVELQKALELSSDAIKSDSTNAAYLDTYGWVQYQMGNYEKALEYTRKAISKSDASAEVFEHLGDIYIKMNTPGKALKAWRKSLEMEPGRKSAAEKIEKHK